MNSVRLMLKITNFDGMRNLLTIVFVLIASLGMAQLEELAGHWTGELTQPGRGLRVAYEMTLDLDVEGDSLIGTSHINFIDKPNIYGDMVFRSKLKGKSLFYKETDIVNQQLENKDQYWCIKVGRMKLTQNDSMYFLDGNWEGHSLRNQPCTPGKLHFEKKKIKIEPEIIVDEEPEIERSTKVGTVMKFNRKTVKVEIIDHTRVDGDIVSIQYNGEWIVKSEKLTKTPIELELDLVEGKENVLVLFADNLGEIPPNSALVKFFDGRRWRKVVLHSDLNESDVVRLVYVKPGK